jgi:hypothetical protein
VSSRDNEARVVPGCRFRVFVDVHHIDPRAEGGSHDPDNLSGAQRGLTMATTPRFGTHS